MRGLETETKKKLKLLVLPIAVLGLFALASIGGKIFASKNEINTDGVCPILPIKAPETFKDDNSTAIGIVHDEKFRKESAKRLSKAVQVETVVFDNPPEVDLEPSYWTKFTKFHEYLEETYPLVHENLKREKVNKYALVYTWEGSNSNLKPLMLTAHQDVVPVQQESLDLWKHPPFEGYYDGKYLFGRGSLDCKNVLTAIMESLELLASKDFKPERTIVVAFGIDEESGGLVGAGHISKFLEERYGKNGIYAIIDEGMPFVKEALSGAIIATPMVAEKGRLTIDTKLLTPGGHSSIPPDHTSIGMMSEFVYLLENSPFEPQLTTENPVLNVLQCVATHFGDRITPDLRKSILKADFDAKSNQKVIDALLKDITTKYFIKTSQAIDIFKGGEKANALPETVTLTSNYRIALESSVDEVAGRFLKYLKIVANKYDLGIEMQGKTIIDKEGKFGSFEVNFEKDYLDPVKSAPYDDTVWEYLAGVSRHLMHDLINTDLEYDFVVAPMTMTANTDTSHYHNLTKNIYRYSPGLGELVAIHSVDEHIEYDMHLHLIAFFYEYIQTINGEHAENK